MQGVEISDLHNRWNKRQLGIKETEMELTDNDIRRVAQRNYEYRMSTVVELGLKIVALKVATAAVQAEIDELCAPEQELKDWCSAKQVLEEQQPVPDPAPVEEDHDDQGLHLGNDK